MKKINRKRKAQKKHKKEPKISLNFFESKYTLQPGVDKRDFKQRERGLANTDGLKKQKSPFT